jgi:hypothetical protein
MSIPPKHSGKYFFHFTHIQNLDSIVKNGILCTNKKIELGITHLDVASETIQERRSPARLSVLRPRKSSEGSLVWNITRLVCNYA